MKRLLVILILAIAVIFNTKANDTDLFSYDKAAVMTALEYLSNIESYITSNPAISINDLMKTGNFLINGIDVSTAPFGINGEAPLGCPSFLWGCTLGVAGIILVYIFSDEDKEEAKKALWGCVTLYAIVGVIYVIAIIGSAASEPYYYSTY
jgi:hypothetical protein